MRKSIWIKGFVFGIILLFVGASIIQNITGEIIQQYDKSYQQTLFSNPPEEEWNRTFAGCGANEVQQTTDGGYIIAGGSYLIKTNENGNELWRKTYREYESVNSVQQTTDGGYILVGSTYHVNDYDILLIKTDENGNQEWRKTFGEYGEYYWEMGISVRQASGGGYIIIGHKLFSNTITWLIKTYPNGTLQWDTTIWMMKDRESETSGKSVQQTTDGGYIIAGYYWFGTSPMCAFLYKVNATGAWQWDNYFWESGAERYGMAGLQTTDGGYIMTGYISSSDGTNLWLVKTNATGIKLWEKTFGGYYNDGGMSIKQTVDGGYIIVGSTSSYGAGLSDVWLIKTDSSGIKQWDKTFGSVDNDYGKSVQETTDGGFIIAGLTSSNIGWLIKLEGDNLPPSSPTINGLSLGIIDIQYIFYITATDPNGDNIYCKWDWGDGNTTDWLGPYTSGQTVCINHSWSQKGTYEIRLKLKDEYGLESNLSDPFVFNVYELKKAFIFGRFTNLTEEEGYITIEAINLRVILFNPFQWLHYVDGEKVIFLKETAKTIMTPRFIFGIVNLVV
jgi:hypothetical protein